jgi:hypothetical protein
MSMLVGKIRMPKRYRALPAVPKKYIRSCSGSAQTGSFASMREYSARNTWLKGDRAPTACRAASGACPRLLTSIAVSLLFPQGRPQNVSDPNIFDASSQTDHTAPKSLLCPGNRRRSRTEKQRTRSTYAFATVFAFFMK